MSRQLKIDFAMKYNSFLVLVILLFSISSCNRKGEVYLQLEQIEDMLFEEKTDSARILLDELADKVGEHEDDYMFYQLLRTRLNYILYSPDFSDSIVNTLVDFYERKGDDEKLAYSYYYKGLPAYERGDANKGMYWLKKAEGYASQTKCHRLKSIIYEALSQTNLNSKNLDNSVSYAKKLLREADFLGNPACQSDALLSLQTAFAFMNKRDSAAFYQLKLIKLIDKLKTPIQKSEAHLAAATYYYNRNNIQKAEEHAQKAYKFHASPEALNILGDIYYVQNKQSFLLELWTQSLDSDVPIMRMQSLRSMRTWYEEHGDTVAAWRIAKWMCELGDSLHQAQQTEAVARVQAKYDVAVTQRKAQQRMWILAMSLIVCVFSFVVYWYYSRIKQSQAHAKITDNQRLIDIYKNELNKRQEEGKERDQHTKQLQQKLDALTHKQQDILSKGHQRYEEIIQGGTVATWHKSDFLDFVEYYRMLNFPFVVEIESTYDSLSPSSTTLLILQEMGYDDEAIKRILCLSPSAFRTKRYRIKQKAVKSLDEGTTK